MDSHIIYKYFNGLSDKQKEQLDQLGELYTLWNQQINVISRKDMDNFYLHHVLHSLSIAKIVKFKDFTEVMDAGTGGGFPGLPLAIMFPDVNFFLVDSIGKKIKVVNEVSTSLGLKNLTAQQIRMEQVDKTFDFIISRAVTYLPDFMRWTGYKFHQKSFNKLKNGILYLKGGDISEEVNAVKRFKTKTYNLNTHFEEEFFETKKLVHVYR
ncbi:MAG: 16S rRNA (guanine(527)-N(7))-methyltransferase RsmG [Marinilabiliales bacterium]|nr:MAG: 16S rRNA (guanine(527)-N(7))-methyltransferase RsmG [Marinilabiliales bacterium]